MIKNHDKFDLHIDGFTPETISISLCFAIKHIQ